MAASWGLFSGLPPCAFSRAPAPTPTQLVAALAPRHVHAIHAVHPAPPRSQPSDPPRPELVDVVAPRASDGQDAPRGGGDVRRRWGAGDVRLWWKSASSGGEVGPTAEGWVGPTRLGGGGGGGGGGSPRGEETGGGGDVVGGGPHQGRVLSLMAPCRP